MATVKKGTSTPAPVRRQHLKEWKKVFWSTERVASKKQIKRDIGARPP